MKKSQIWSIDFIIGMVMFIFIIILSVKMIFSMNINTDYEALYRDGVHISNALMSPRYPLNWNTSNVVSPGIMLVNTTNRIDMAQIQEYDKLDYMRTKTLLHSTHEYLFYFRNATEIINVTNCTRGYPVATDANCTPILSGLHYKDLIKIERVVIYNSSMAELIVYVWE